ncbi:oxygenase MpaB family protein [Amycolatopsis rhizosphaerae]|uniref:oxygenase MpaB family protein n=1 Tax=Amycolatopsis rhizosphaerae TaxID=2053003 RepID=UPI0016436D50|nr:oxygenase MpaB family protein [Amycolatopsis rhizosphaerae]
MLWDVAGELRAALVIPSTLVLQVMHPMVGAAVGAHSVFRTDPWGRAERTSKSMLRYLYGGPAAAAEGRRLRELHAPIRGVDEHGRAYHALDGAAYAWVNCSAFERYVTACRLFGPPLDRARENELYQDIRRIGLILRVPTREMPATAGEFWAYFDDMVAHRLERNATTDELLEAIRHPPPPPASARWSDRAWRGPGRLLGGAAGFLTTGTLPPEIREILGLRWTNSDQRRLGRWAAVIRATFTLLPPRLRYLPSVARIRDGRTWPGRR